MHISVSFLATSFALLGLACGAAPATDPGAPSPTDSTEAPPPATVDDAPVPGSGAAKDVVSAVGTLDHASNGSSSTPTAPTSTTPPPPPPLADDPGPQPTTACSISTDASGFFTRSGAFGSYVGYLPASYDGRTPTRLVVGLHGCGDTAYNFATWGVNPYDGRAAQSHIGISVGGTDGACWTKGTDDPKVLAAMDDVMSCFWIHQKKVTLAGFSSGGELAYRVGMIAPNRFAGLLIESSGLYAASDNEDTLIASAGWKLPIAHRQHSGDTVFSMSQVQADWTKLAAAGFPLETSITAGDHNGTSTDWNDWLLPKSATWVRP